MDLQESVMEEAVHLLSLFRSVDMFWYHTEENDTDPDKIETLIGALYKLLNSIMWIR